MRRFRWIALAAVLGVAVTAHGQTADFLVSQHGKQVGTASFRIAPAAQGYDSTSLVNVSMQGLDYALSKNEELTASREIMHSQISATVNGEAVSITVAPDSAQLLMNTSANGRSTTTRLAAHAEAVLLPDFDPGALETLLVLAAAHDNGGLWAVIPKQAGSVDAVTLATYADEKGTLDGKPITVHHLVATIAGAQTVLFSGPDNELLQAELPQDGFALVRKGFVLTPPAKPEAPMQ
ncbi:MAG TPA: hypothetical protein VG893_14500 [Terracidiphilus sp.]|nr:hypothetical protein [Terracidiphilus sp.]